MSSKNISVFKAIVVGQLIVNLPVTIIILGAMFCFIVLGLKFNLGLIIGGALGWLYWSFVIPKWRKWALHRGVDEGKLYKWGQITLLMWKKGSVFEKTEIDLSKKK